MNILGYYEATDVWIPDPILQKSDDSKIMRAIKLVREQKSSQMLTNIPTCSSDEDPSESASHYRSETLNLTVNPSDNIWQGVGDSLLNQNN